ncbi:MAG TPA: two-component regulator propeller domain-containing protein [Candidatus Hydrogenedentes bacterium]|nr:two-component regulator propeller domain-containing protein [Candidatus Hydrogenedentota bacterium]HOL76151.1 two-component regulator propeller domain-containing protein [Candidatus Hydrogenedentota bacterium]HPO84766.1 two-component regulator propeller domain-containing protein [Candidatus Hydrogenedentota bacterium]
MSIMIAMTLLTFGQATPPSQETLPCQNARVDRPYFLANVVPALDDPDDAHWFTYASKYIPVPDIPFVEHVRGNVSAEEEARVIPLLERALNVPKSASELEDIRCVATKADDTWIGTENGLFHVSSPDAKPMRHPSYGVDGPLATRITGLVFDSKGVLWVGTPLGLSRRDTDGQWNHIRGKEGLPVEDVTCLAVDEQDRLWIGTSVGAILYKPYEEGRRWFYRAGRRYLPGNYISAIAIMTGGMPVYFKTDGGIGRLDGVQMTLRKRADIIENVLNQRHRRLGLVAACTLDNAEDPKDHFIVDDDNDGLWTAYHVAAMSLAYAVTGDPEHRKSAREGMHALYMLQNASGIPGLVARSVLPAEEGKKKREEAQNNPDPKKREAWRPTPDGKMYWKSDTSSDEIVGHYLAFYTYWRHIARHDPEERVLLEKQIRTVTDYIVNNGYYLIDWDGKPTTWGKWAPEVLNGDPRRYGENGLGSLEILSFLKTAYCITGDEKYKKCFDDLICDHNYLSNLLLQKKVFPDENNHSDNQLAHSSYYPILQLEGDPKVRQALQQSVRRHYKTIAHEHSSYFDFVTATIDLDFVDIAGAVQTLRDVPTDRRLWAMRNSHRADIQWNPRPNRFGKPVLLHVLPADERNFGKWNIDPFEPDSGGNFGQRVSGTPLSPLNSRSFGPSREGDGRNEDDGAAWLIAYWMGRYHGFIAPSEEEVQKTQH